MCLAIPGRVIDWLEHESPFKSASVEFGGVRREVSMQCVPEAEIGDYVLVHAGIAISRLDAEEATRVLDAIAQLEDNQQESPRTDASETSFSGDDP